MIRTKSGRCVLLGGTAAADPPTGPRAPARQRAAARRIVLIRNGRFVGRKRSCSAAGAGRSVPCDQSNPSAVCRPDRD
jgi:hypothetical protein